MPAHCPRHLQLAGGATGAGAAVDGASRAVPHRPICTPTQASPASQVTGVLGGKAPCFRLALDFALAYTTVAGACRMRHVAWTGSFRMRALAHCWPCVVNVQGHRCNGTGVQKAKHVWQHSFSKVGGASLQSSDLRPSGPRRFTPSELDHAPSLAPSCSIVKPGWACCCRHSWRCTVRARGAFALQRFKKNLETKCQLSSRR